MSLKTITETIAEHAAVLSHAISTVAGLTGGCYVAAYAYIRGRKVTPYLVVAYMVIGAVSALATAITIKILTGVMLGFEQSVIVGTVVGVVNVLAIAGYNFKASFNVPNTNSKIEIGIKERQDG